ncbi:aminopeptidase [bacterium]|nr:aminopeptidase [bacterium]
MMKDRAMETAINRLYTQNLGVKSGETVMVFTDKAGHGGKMPSSFLESKKDMANLVSLIERLAPAGVGVNKVVFDSTGGHGKEPPEELWKAAFGKDPVECLKSEGLWSGFLSKSLNPGEIARAEDIFVKHSAKPVDAVIGLSYYSTSHTRFRDFLTRLFKVRYASMPLFDCGMFDTAMTADWEKVAELSRIIAGLIRPAEKVEIHAPNGTDLKMGLRGVPVHEDTGILTKPGSFGNLPAGEVFLPPEAGTTEGRLVMEWGPAMRLESQVTLFIEKGEATGVEGYDAYAAELERFLDKDRNYRNIAELGIGTNDRASRPDNILESEKILGTIHIALGDNSSFGGNVRTPFHQDFVVFHPTVTLIYSNGDKKQILAEGRLTDDIKH